MSFFLLAFPTLLSINASIYIGAYMLEFFGISLLVLRIAGGVSDRHGRLESAQLLS
jgi:small neutral amino acid transporter SnatA (MarC family)